MDLFDVVRSCFRRWYVFLPLLLITAWHTHSVYTAVKPVYYSQAVVGLAPPSFRLDQAVAGQPVPRNGLLDIGGAPFVANMAALALREPTVVNRVVALGGMPDYGARLFPVPANQQPLPLVMLEETAPDPKVATKTLELVADEMQTTLEEIQKQANVPPDMMVQSFQVSPPSDPIAAMPTRTRATASIAVVGIGAAVVIAVLTDVFLGRWKRRRKLRRSAPSEELSTNAGSKPDVLADADYDGSIPTERVHEPRRTEAADL